jgi:RNA polymerase sigma-70 factor (ECF subfamily)
MMPVPAAADLDRTDDSTLVLKVQAGDSGAFEPLVDRYLMDVRAFLALRAPVSHLVDELAHETFVYAFQHSSEFTAGTSFRHWLRAIAWNLLRAEIQRFSRQQSNQARLAAQWLGEAERGAVEPQTSREVEFLEACVKQLPPPMRELLTLKYTHECPTGEIARKLQRSLAWVRTVLFRLRQELKECIEVKLGRKDPC